MKLNLPAHYSTLQDYVDDLVAKFRCKYPNTTKLHIDDFHYPDIDLEGEEYFDAPTICMLLTEAENSPHVDTLEFRFVEITDEVASSLVRLLTSKVPRSSIGAGKEDSADSGGQPMVQRTWEMISIIGCTGLESDDSELFRAFAAGSIRCKKLLLNHNNTRDHGLASLGEFLGRSSITSTNNLTSLNLKREHLKGDGARAFFHGLRNNNHVTELVLNFCRFDNDGVDAFAAALSANTTVRSLDLGACYLADDQVCMILSALTGHPRLEHLVLTLNACHASGSVALAGLLAHPTTQLVSLNLSHQKVDATRQTADPNDELHKLNMEVIAASLQRNTKLQILKLGRNRLQLEDLRPLLCTLTEFNTTLSVLDLNNNAFEDEGFRYIASMLPRIQGLQKLYLLNNAIRQKTTGRIILDGIQGNTSIRAMELNNTAMLYSDIQRVTAMNRAGRVLLKTEHHIPTSVWPTVLSRANRIAWHIEYPDAKERGSGNLAHDILYAFLHGPLLLNRWQ